MRKTISIVFTCLTAVVFAQTSNGKLENEAKIVLNTYVPEQIEGLTPAVSNILYNKLNQVAIANGVGGDAVNPRFVLTTNISVLTKDVTPTAPPMHAYTLDVTLYIGDGFDGTLYSSQSLTLKGVGTNETKAYINALNALKPNDAQLKNFIQKGKNKIIEFYNGKCDVILKEAQTIANQNRYEEAIAKLTAIPDACQPCYDKAVKAIGPLYQRQIDKDCKVKLAEATNLWNSNPSYDGAGPVGEILTQIDPNAACYKEAKALSSKIAQRIKELDQREWNYQLKEQQANIDIEKAAIKAARDIGVAYGKGQAKVEYKVYSWW